jgi:hypothetical protein
MMPADFQEDGSSNRYLGCRLDYCLVDVCSHVSSFVGLNANHLIA